MRCFLLGVGLLVLAGCSDAANVNSPERTDDPSTDPSTVDPTATLRPLDRARAALSGGATTVFDATSTAFSQPAPNLTGEDVGRHEAGDEEFSATFVAGAAPEHGGLGPVFDNTSCESCHVGDGRGRPPLPGEPFNSLLFRTSVPGVGPHGGPLAARGFGTQLQLRAIAGYQPEVQAAVQYAESVGTFADRSTFQLRVPRYSFSNSYLPLPGGLLVSPRAAPAVFGLGLLEAVPEGVLHALSDENDRNRDGISGRLNYVWDEARGRPAVGRFGWKANAPNLTQQSAGAFNGDMGITSSLFPAESCEGDRPGCERHAPEVADQTVQNVAFYTRTLGVPARRNLDDPKAREGELLFLRAGCGSCHFPTLPTGSLPGVSEVSNQLIHPYTDLLLHDMGPALADGRPDFRASGSEWRTPPLWGIGLVQVVNGHTNFLHDGRARSLLEAVLWHGGEAERAREAVRRFSPDQRTALIAFLQSL